MSCFKTRMKTEIGMLSIEADENAITAIDLLWEKPEKADQEENCENELTLLAEKQLLEYFAGKRKIFELPLKPKGTCFQQQVWKELCKIPYGQISTYGELAAGIGKEKAARAVGMALHNNPILIVIPCHRVIGKNGNLTGFGAGLPAKKFLLRLEKKGSN